MTDEVVWRKTNGPPSYLAFPSFIIQYRQLFRGRAGRTTPQPRAKLRRRHPEGSRERFHQALVFEPNDPFSG
jgi:hypothetical protein